MVRNARSALHCAPLAMPAETSRSLIPVRGITANLRMMDLGGA